MKQLAEFQLTDGTKLLVEVDEPERGTVERVALPSGRLVIKAKQSFEEIIENVQPIASAIFSKLNSSSISVDEVEVKFGVKLSVDAGVIFTSVGGEANYEITLRKCR